MQLVITGAHSLCKTDIIFSLLINFCGLIGKECGSNVSSHLLGGALRDETKPAERDTDVLLTARKVLCASFREL